MMESSTSFPKWLQTSGKILGLIGAGVQLSTDGLQTYASEQLFKIADNQKFNAMLTANLQEAQTLNQTNMSWSKSSQEQVRNILESMQKSLLSTLQTLCQPIVAAAEAVRRA